MTKFALFRIGEHYPIELAGEQFDILVDDDSLIMVGAIKGLSKGVGDRVQRADMECAVAVLEMSKLEQPKSRSTSGELIRNFKPDEKVRIPFLRVTVAGARRVLIAGVNLARSSRADRQKFVRGIRGSAGLAIFDYPDPVLRVLRSFDMADKMKTVRAACQQQIQTATSDQVDRCIEEALAREVFDKMPDPVSDDDDIKIVYRFS